MYLNHHLAQPYKEELRYRGLRPHDKVIWDEFIRRYPDAFDMVWYDTVIGDPTKPGDDEVAMRAGGAYQVMQWRVDVIGLKDDQYTIIEVKPNALAGAIGQTLCYKAIMVQEGRLPENTNCVVLTDSLSPITEKAGKLLNVTALVP